MPAHGRVWGPWVPLWVAGSSFLGLSGRFLLSDPGEDLPLFFEAWSASLASDLVFVAASVAAFGAGWEVTRRGSTGRGVAVSALGHWVAYWVSFLSLPDLGEPGAEALTFVVRWGWPGLVFASAVAPMHALRHRARMEAAAKRALCDQRLQVDVRRP